MLPLIIGALEDQTEPQEFTAETATQETSSATEKTDTAAAADLSKPNGDKNI